MKCLRLMMLGAAAALTFDGQAASKPAPPAKQKISYYQQVRPVFQANCQGCHQPAKSKGGYVMTDFKLLLGSGDSKLSAVVPRQPDKSNLLKLITPVDGKAEMPQGGKPLHAAELALVRDWIAQGAVDDTPANARERYDMNHPPVYSLPPVITSIDYSPDGQFLAVAGFHEVMLHRADGSGIAARLVGLSERIESVRFSPDGTKLAVAGGLPGRMGEIQIWVVAERKLFLSVPSTFDTVYGANWSPDGKLIAFGCSDNSVRAIDAVTGQQVLFQGTHTDWVLDTVFSVKGDNLISVGRDMTAKLTEVPTQRFIDNITSITPNALKGGIQSVARHASREEVIFGGADGLPKVYQIFRESARKIGDDSNGILQLDAMHGRVFSVAFSRDGTVLAAGSALDGAGEVLATTYTFGTNAIPKEMKEVMAKIPTGRNDADRAVIAKYKNSGVRTLFKASVPQSGIFAVAITPDGKQVAAAGSDGRIRVFEAATGSIVRDFISVKVAATKTLAAKKFNPVPAASPAPTDGEPEALPKDVKVLALTVEPPNITLPKWTDSAQLIVYAELANGDRMDVTRIAQLKVSSSSIAEVTTGGAVFPKANGSTSLKVAIAGRSASVPIKVSGASPGGTVDFLTEVNPVLTKAGCNQGTCHGSKDGKNGFKLSLRGYDAVFDVRAFTDELASRRANVASPDDSLMLLKPTGAVPHVGSKMMEPGDRNYRVIREWIAGGARLNADSPRVSKIEVFPKNPVVQKVGSRQQMRVVATYADGRTRDVTTQAFIETGNQDVAKTDATGLVTTLRRGEAPMLARFEGAYDATTVTVMGDRTGFAWSEPPVWNKVDEFAAAKWKRMQILPSDLCTDSEFIRRIYLDLTGVPPGVDEVKKFLADTRETRVKRDEVIDRLIGSADFIDHWSNKWADLLQVNRKFLGEEGAKLFREWIRKEVAANTPYDQFAHKIITASGSNRENPAASYYKVLRSPMEIMENTTHLFLATRFNCNKCHDHPFERWTQDQYYQTSAFFARTALKKDPAAGDKLLGGTAVEGGKPVFEIVYDQDKGEVLHERTGKETSPEFPFKAACEPTTEKSEAKPTRREQLASWITAKDNRYFATSYANRVWGYLTGVGIIEPLDDIRAGNPPSNPELLGWLTREFIQSGFDVRQLMRTICQSRTYQLSFQTTKWNEDDKINFSHATPRRLSAEVLYDAIYKVTGASSKIPGVPAGTRAAQLPDDGFKLNDGFFASMGKPPRESACECERVNEVQLGPVMAMISSATVGDAVSDPESALAKLVAGETDNRKLVEEIFLRILNRSAKPTEIEASLKAMASLERDHGRVKTELSSYEKIYPGIQETRVKRRATDLADVTTELAGYEREIAPREADLDKQQKERIAKAEVELKRFDAEDFPKRAVEFEKKQDLKVAWSLLAATAVKATGDLKLEQQADKSIVVASGKDVRSVYTVTTDVTESLISGLRLEAIGDPKLPKGGPGRAPDGNFVVNEFAVTFTQKGAKPADAKKVELTKPLADFSQANFEVAKAIDGGNDRQTGWAISPNGGATHWATFELKQPLTNAAGGTLTFTLTQQFNGGNDKAYTLGRFRLSATSSKSPGLSQSEELRQLLATPSADRTKEQAAAVEKLVRSTDAELAKRTKELADAKAPRPIDPHLKELRDSVARLSLPLVPDPKLTQLKRADELSTGQLQKQRLVGAQDIAWALLNHPAFLFNH